MACKDHAKDPTVIAIKENSEQYVCNIKEILDNKSFHYSVFKRKLIWERGKQRNLCFTNTMPDRIIQHCVFNIVTPILHGSMIKNEYAAIKGRGVQSGITAIYNTLKKDPVGTRYAEILDIQKFFDGIDRNILFDMIKKKIKCHDTLEILKTIIFDTPGNLGLPIGLYSSQVLSVFYLNGLDHYCKETLRIKYFFRYMDDILIFASTKILLHSYRIHIQNYLAKVKLKLKNNWAVFPICKRRVDFLGYVISHKGIALRKKVRESYQRCCNSIICNIKHGVAIDIYQIRSKRSYEGFYSWCNLGSFDKIQNSKIEYYMCVPKEFWEVIT